MNKEFEKEHKAKLTIESKIGMESVEIDFKVKELINNMHEPLESIFRSVYLSGIKDAFEKVVKFKPRGSNNKTKKQD